MRKINPHDSDCFCWYCHDPYEEDEYHPDEDYCEDCGYHSHYYCHCKYDNIELYEKRKKRENIINSILNENQNHFDQLKELY